MFLQFCLVTCLQYTILFVNIQVNFVFLSENFSSKGKKGDVQSVVIMELLKRERFLFFLVEIFLA